jgi:hypothetical protein
MKWRTSRHLFRSKQAAIHCWSGCALCMASRARTLRPGWQHGHEGGGPEQTRSRSVQKARRPCRVVRLRPFLLSLQDRADTRPSCPRQAHFREDRGQGVAAMKPPKRKSTRAERAQRAVRYRAWYQRKHGIQPRIFPRREALVKGKRTYVGKLCPHDHPDDSNRGSLRYTISGCCIACVAAMSRRRLTKAGRAHIRKLERARDRRKALALKTCLALGISI